MRKSEQRIVLKPGFLVKISIVGAGAATMTTMLPAAAAASGSASPPEYCTQCVRKDHTRAWSTI